MGSGYFGEPSLGNERGTGSSSASKRGKKGSSDKQPRQPQRGLGVAQLEKIRLHGEIASAAFHPTPYTFNNDVANVHTRSLSVPPSTSSSSSYGFPSNVMMGFGEYEGRSLRDGDSQHSTAARWDPSNGGILETQHFAHPNMTSYPQAEWTESRKSKRHERSGKMAQNSEACESQELDLELRLSII